jgi:hypothetical protein
MSFISRPSAWIAICLSLLPLSRPLLAQGWTESQLWVVAVASDPAAFGGGIGIALRDARRTRLSAALATGATDSGLAAGRLEIAWHFLLDPSRRRGVSVYGGGGLALSALEGDRLRPWLQLQVGAEWHPAGARGLFIEAGAGGGARLAAGLRWRKRNAPVRRDRGAP